MNIDYIEEEWVEDDWDDDEAFADAAGEIAEAAQQCIAQPGGLNKAFQNIMNSAKLFGFSAFIKVASIEEQSGAMSKMKDVIAQTLGQQSTEQNAPQSVKSFAQHLIQDPESSSNQKAINTVIEYLSLRETSSDDILQPSEIPKKHRSARRFELEEYSDMVTTALHNTFYTSNYLPCTCSCKGGAVCLSKEYVCALRLDGYQHVPGDDNHCFFDSVIAGKDDESHQWTPVQFQLPRKTRDEVRVGLPADPANVENKQSSQEVPFIALDDFCTILTWNIRCFRVHVNKSLQTDLFGWSKDRTFSAIFPQQGAPTLLSTALKQDEISARHRILLAFTISKAFWQYYDSDWMNVEWSLETIQLLQTSNLDSQAPFLKIKSNEFEGATYHEHESVGTSDGVPHLHPYPYILNLGLLLVQLGSITPDRTSISANVTQLTGTKKNNDLCISCCTEISADSEWPQIMLLAKQKPRYRRIVEECLPTQSQFPKAMFDGHLDAIGRRLALQNHVVRPLFELFQDMADPDETALPLPKGTQDNGPSVLQADDDAKESRKTPSAMAWDWLDSVTKSWLHGEVSVKVEGFRRPKIAIIDTGFDSGARFLNPKLKQRLYMHSGTETKKYNWKDFWQYEAVPNDSHGHGTAMLSIVLRIAPFADICVARIAGTDEDLKRDPEKTSKNLAKAILWAVEEQDADIISLSLGWEQERRVNKDRVISNAISKALSHRNQNLLIFAAASNLGGSKRELFPAKHQTVFSIRGTNTKGKHKDFNPELPNGSEEAFGTLGFEVPTSNRGKLAPTYINRNGTSVATAIAAGIAAIVVGYINIHDATGLWDNIRTFKGFKNLLGELSTEPEVRKRFITLDNHSKQEDQMNFETAMSSASNSKKGQ